MRLNPLTVLLCLLAGYGTSEIIKHILSSLY